ncbi:hypothetical protein ACFOU2_09485 [Bacillus songklensis]|uniref:Uncharacterized protein n=1 Tax=Bacillus songklensis TaxID=1069116 RepID=A0ABV8B3B6_9BACI
MEEKKDPFTQLMFGSHRKSKEQEKQTKEDFSPGTDWNQLINQIQEIAASIQSLKPLIKEFSPLLDLFQKKNK